MVEDVERIRAEFQGDSFRSQREGLPESHIHVEIGWTTQIVSAADIEADRTDEISIRLARVCESIQRLALAAVQVEMKVRDRPREDGGRIVCISSHKRIGSRKVCISAVPARKAADAPPSDHLVEPPRRSSGQRFAAPKRQIVDEIPLK